MTELEIRRTIAAPPERLFAAWTTPALLQQWWGPAGVRCVAAEVDLRPGGAYRIGNAFPDGRVVWIAGEFEVVDAPRMLVYSWIMGDDAPSRVTVRFEPAGPATEIVIRHERIATAAHRDSHALGWGGCLDGLVRWADAIAT